MKKFDTSLYFITDSTNYAEAEFLYRVERALMGGVTILQLREKNKTTREYITLAQKVHELAKKYAGTGGYAEIRDSETGRIKSLRAYLRQQQRYRKP